MLLKQFKRTFHVSNFSPKFRGLRLKLKSVLTPKIELMRSLKFRVLIKKAQAWENSNRKIFKKMSKKSNTNQKTVQLNLHPELNHCHVANFLFQMFGRFRFQETGTVMVFVLLLFILLLKKDRLETRNGHQGIFEGRHANLTNGAPTPKFGQFARKRHATAFYVCLC